MGNKRVKNISYLSTTNRTIRLIMTAVMSAALLVGLAHVPRAAAAQESATATANTLKVSPVRSDIELKPGESKTIKTIVTNLTKEAISVKPVTNDFVSGDERGAPALILAEDEFAPSHSLKRFMSPLEPFTIPAEGTQVVEVTLNAPRDAKAGGYYGAVRFAPTDPDGGGQVNLSASVASIILATIPGDVTEKLTLAEFDIQQSGTTKTYFTTPDDLQATFRFHNTGGVHHSPFGKVSVKKGDTVVYETDFNEKTPRDMILPDSYRRWDVPLDKIGNFGKYEVHATFTYGSKNQTIEVTKSFWVIPQLYIILALVALVILLIAIGLVIWAIVRKRQNRKPRTSSGRGR